MGFEPTTLRDLVACSTTELLETLAVSKGQIVGIDSALSISFEVDVPTRKVDGSLFFECLKFRCLEMLFSTFSRQYLGLRAIKITAPFNNMQTLKFKA